MTFSYSSFKNDIVSFKNEEYIKTLDDPTLYNSFVDFIESYRQIETEDFKKPIFSQTTKFKKIPNNFKNFKYQKINRESKEADENNNQPIQFSFENPVNDNEKISFMIRTYLNKISKDTYKKISLEFINELCEIKNNGLFEILCIEILKKCLFDNKYRNLYINLCYKIWTNKQIHNNLINVIVKDGKYYWVENGKEALYGPFSSDNLCSNDAYMKLNFKKYFLNNIQKLYNNKDVDFKNLSEEEEYIKKKKVLLLVELITIMYSEKYINFDIINIIIIDLLHITNSFVPIIEIEFESLHLLLKNIQDNKLNSLNHLTEYKIIFEEYINIIQGISDIENTKRSVFFLNEILEILNDLANISKKSMKNVLQTAILQTDAKSNVTPISNVIINYENILFDKLNEWNVDELYDIFNKVNENKMGTLIYKIIDKSVSGKVVNPNLYKLLNKIGNKDNILNNVIEKFIGNIEDIELDVHDIRTKLFEIIEECELNMELKDRIDEYSDDSD
jgi:hypothetical protein